MDKVLKRQVLNAYKDLHRARQMVFKDDASTLEAARQRINEEFKKHKHVKDTSVIEELLAFSKAVVTELRTSVVQAEEISPGTFRLNIRPETNKLDNVPFKDCGSG